MHKHSGLVQILATAPLMLTELWYYMEFSASMFLCQHFLESLFVRIKQMRKYSLLSYLSQSPVSFLCHDFTLS